MLTSTHMRVLFGKSLSSEFKVGNGTRQGGILSPLLYNIYINDVIESISKCSIGCQLGYHRTNILCYADDLVLMCPAKEGLQVLVEKAAHMLSSLCLKINYDKCSYVVHKVKYRSEPIYKIYIEGNEVKSTSEFKYLGVIINSNGTISSDVERMCFSFLAQFNAMYHKFNFMTLDSLRFLFFSFCCSFYGVESWFTQLQKPNSFKKLSVAYHKAVKRVCKLNVWDSNHLACSMLGANIFKHLLVKRCYKFFGRLISGKGQCIRPLQQYFLLQSSFVLKLREVFQIVYQVDDFLLNDSDALMSRIDYVQNHEPCSFHALD